MSHVQLETLIGAPPGRVWRALCRPAEVVQWDSAVAEALDAPADYPKPGQHVRWRCRSGLFRILHDRPREVLDARVLRSLLGIGIVRYDETYTLQERDGGTLLRVDLTVSVIVPVLGTLIDRLRARADARAAFEASLANLKRWCEEDRDAVSNAPP